MPLKTPFKSKATIPALLIALLAVLVILYAWRLWPFSSARQTTENAYVRGSVTVIAPKVDGYVAQVRVQDYMQVKAGQVLVELDARNYRQRLDQAQANLAAQQANLSNSTQAQRVREAAVANVDAQLKAAQANLARAQADMRRAEALVGDGSLSKRERDQTLAALRQAEASMGQAQAARRSADEDVRSVIVNRDALTAAVANARAALKLAEIDLANTRILAPQDGQLGEIGVRLGQYVTPGTQLMQLVPHRVWVVANFKESQTAGIRPGQAAWFRVDALDGKTLRGRVERLSPATGSEFSVIKTDNATGNFTKVAQRLPVRIALEPGRDEAERALVARLRPGMSVEATVDTASAIDADAVRRAEQAAAADAARDASVPALQADDGAASAGAAAGAAASPPSSAGPADDEASSGTLSNGGPANDASSHSAPSPAGPPDAAAAKRDPANHGTPSR
ncbi:HlyD secretion family protein [Lysobacter enzymogenes]|uniref:HlyD secretion family protein n=1 Tax=Lysobacter enzymogenes TaxID=69 RepID=A0A0S2DQB2_LYSEN|nr:HlyD family secretion protein [Lysobacter enzymogenes]ALN60754.1 HlyD secretion family protein [Lysobacter enzymogenes]